MHQIAAALALFSLLSSPSYSGAVLRSQRPAIPDSLSDSVSRIAESVNEFGINLYKEVSTGEGNLCLSPLSLHAVLTMTSFGASGETQEEMAKTLLLPSNIDAIGGPYGCMLNAIKMVSEERAKASITIPVDTAAYQTPVVEVTADVVNPNWNARVANSLWILDDLQLREAFLRQTASFPERTVYSLDPVSAEESRRKINEWIEGATRGRIEELFPPGSLDPASSLVLANALWFKGYWASYFYKHRTHDESFFLSREDSVSVPMMRQTHEFGYTRSPGLQALEMEFLGEGMRMMFLLPDSVGGLAALEEQLTWGNLSGWIDSLHIQEVQVYLPRYELSNRSRVDNHLKRLGMELAFDPVRADFSGMVEDEIPLWIGSVYHASWLELHERGVEAAAASGVVMSSTSYSIDKHEPPVFRADHPFLFLIRDNITGLILFLGRVTDPTSE